MVANLRLAMAFAGMSVCLAGCQSAGLALINATAQSTTRLKNVTYDNGPRGHMDILVPKGEAAAAPRPLVVFWYGGSWQSGERADYRFAGSALAVRGAVVAIPDYRLYPEVTFPDFLKDAARAVAEAQRQAAGLGADPRHTVLGGHSAGAYIAAMLALEPRYLREAGVDPASIAGFFGLSGPYDIDPNTPALDAIFTARAPPAEFRPVARVTANAPPALLIHGEADDFVYASHSTRLADALRAQGVAVTLRIYPKRGHIDTLLALSRIGGFRIPGLADEIGAFVRSCATGRPYLAPS